MYRTRKFFAICLALAALFTVIPFVTASAAVQTQVISGSSQAGRFGRQTTTEKAAIVLAVTDSQALHTKGYSTTISVSSSKTLTCTASASVTAGVNVVFGSISASMGVSTSVAFTTGASVSYGIDKNTASGRYRIEHVYPSVQVKQEIVYSDKNGSVVEWQRTITSAPKMSAAYRRLTRYANP